jgi:hypothetical protein
MMLFDAIFFLQNTRKEVMNVDKNTNEERLMWHPCIREMPQGAGISYPIFEWSYGIRKGLRGGELRIWPFQKKIAFSTRRGGEDRTFSEPEAAIRHVVEYGWGEPVSLKEAWECIRDIKLPFDNLNEAKRTSDELRQKWNVVFVNSGYGEDKTFEELKKDDVYLELGVFGDLSECEKLHGAILLKKTGDDSCETLDGSVRMSGQDPNRRVRVVG